VHSTLPASVVQQVHNNIGALLVGGGVALLVGIVVLVVERRSGDKASTGHLTSRIVLLGVTAVLLGIGVWLLRSDDILDLHGWSAVAMFAVLAITSIFNGIWLLWLNRGTRPKTSPRWKLLAILYISVGVAMAVAGIVIKIVVPGPWDQRILVLEIVEISLFAAMWTVQSVERWGKTLQVQA
jgi:hypothetical protein